MRYRFINEVFDRLIELNSTKEKVELLKSMQGDRLLETILRLSFDRNINFNVSAIPEYRSIGSYDGLQLIRALEDMERMVADFVKVDTDAIDYLELTLMSLIPEDAEILEQVVMRNLKGGLTYSIVDAAFPNLLRPYEFINTITFDENNLEFPCSLVVHESHNKVLIQANKFGRYIIKDKDGNIFDDDGVFENLGNTLSDQIIIEGQIQVHKKKRCSTAIEKRVFNKGLKSKLTDDDKSNLKLFVTDCFPKAYYYGEDVSYKYSNADAIDLINNQLHGKIENVYREIHSICKNETSVRNTFKSLLNLGIDKVSVKINSDSWSDKSTMLLTLDDIKRMEEGLPQSKKS